MTCQSINKITKKISTESLKILLGLLRTQSFLKVSSQASTCIVLYLKINITMYEFN